MWFFDTVTNLLDVFGDYTIVKICTIIIIICLKLSHNSEISDLPYSSSFLVNLAPFLRLFDREFSLRKSIFIAVYLSEWVGDMIIIFFSFMGNIQHESNGNVLRSSGGFKRPKTSPLKSKKCLHFPNHVFGVNIRELYDGQS